MSSDPRDPKFGLGLNLTPGPPRDRQQDAPSGAPAGQTPDQPPAAPAGEAPEQRPEQPPAQPGQPPIERFQPRSGPRPVYPANPQATAGASRPTPPWDLTTRVPAAVQRHVNPEDLTLLAMQLLPPEEAASIGGHVEHCAECRRELAQIRADLGAYAFAVEMHDPPASAREGLLRKIAREKKAIPISHSRSTATIASFGRTTSILVPEGEEDAPRPSRAPVVLAWTGWAAAAALAITGGILYKDRDALRSTLAGQSGQIARLTTDAAQARRLMDAVTDPHAQRVTLSTKPLPPAPLGRATYNADKGTLIFLASDMDQLQPDKTYELWLIPADGSASLPAGTFHPDEAGNASVIMPSIPKGIPAKGFGITIEPEGGSDTPTKPIIMVGF